MTLFVGIDQETAEHRYWDRFAKSLLGKGLSDTYLYCGCRPCSLKWERELRSAGLPVRQAATEFKEKSGEFYNAYELPWRV